PARHRPRVPGGADQGHRGRGRGRREPLTATIRGMRRAIALALIAACSSSSGTTAADAPLGSGPDARVGGPDAAPGASDANPTAPEGGPGPLPTITLALQQVAGGMSQPMAIMIPPGDNRFFVAEKTGTVSIVVNGVKQTPPFIDIHGQVSQGSEE